MTVFNADGSVAEHAPIDVRAEAAGAARSSETMVEDQQVAQFGPVGVEQTTRTLLKFQFTGRVYTEHYAFYLVSGAFSRHERLKKGTFRGYYYGEDAANTIGISCNVVKRDGSFPNYTESYNDNEIKSEDADVTFNYIVGPTSQTPPGSTVSASCTHVVTKDGYNKTLSTAI